MSTKKLVYEVSIIRPLVIFLLVVFHCFCVHSGGWETIDSITPVPAYYWFAKLISGFRIETIALVAGYIFSYQKNDLKREQPLMSLIKQKFKRLILPCWAFGVFYWLLIMRSSIPVDGALLYIVNGAAHLWFLPMLFWCFIFLWLIHRYQPGRWWTFAVLSVLSICPMPSLPLGLTRMPHFIFYAYSGYLLWIYREAVYRLFLKKSWIVAFVVLYLVLLYCNCSLKHFGEAGYVLPLYAKILVRVTKLLLTFTGISALYLTVCTYTTKANFVPADWVIRSSKICYGVYIFHQFILKWLFYQTSFPEMVGGYWLPWAGLAIALPLSIGLSILFLRTRVGRFLIG